MDHHSKHSSKSPMKKLVNSFISFPEKKTPSNPSSPSKHSSVSSTLSSDSLTFYFTPKQATYAHTRSQSQNNPPTSPVYQPIRHNSPFMGYNIANTSASTFDSNNNSTFNHFSDSQDTISHHKPSSSISSKTYHGVYSNHKQSNSGNITPSFQTPDHSYSMVNSGPNWTTLIPPLPGRNEPAKEPPANTNVNGGSNNLKLSQRHSIAISPNRSEVSDERPLSKDELNRQEMQSSNPVVDEKEQSVQHPQILQHSQQKQPQQQVQQQGQQKQVQQQVYQQQVPQVQVVPNSQPNQRQSQQVTYHSQDYHPTGFKFNQTEQLSPKGKDMSPGHPYQPQPQNRAIKHQVEQIPQQQYAYNQPKSQPRQMPQPYANVQGFPSMQRQPSTRRPSVPPPTQPPKDHPEVNTLAQQNTQPRQLQSTQAFSGEEQLQAQSSILGSQNLPSQQNSSLQANKRNKSVRRKNRKVCHKCGLEITGQFVRALKNPYHVECFVCNDCGKQCSEKFFPYEIPGDSNESQLVALCEYDYFKKLDLICFNCNSALRGPYITALGNKYHLEHFKCAVCQKVFESDESYYEHASSIYCHFHYSKLFASKCEGCRSSIVKQFVELFRGGRNQQWHPECYMVHKFWNVYILADSVGLSSKLNIESSKIVDLINDTNDANLLHTIEHQIETTVMNCWLTLSGYEETTAACISDMLLNAFISNQPNGLLSTGKLILNIEILFGALDGVMEMTNSPLVKDKLEAMSPNGDIDDSTVSSYEAYFQPLKKEPRNISGKIMSYLAILRKSSQINTSGSLSGELLSVITGCAHYLKLLIRLGLDNALKLNKLLGTTEAMDQFLGRTRQYENYLSEKEKDEGGSLVPNDRLLASILSRLTIPSNSTDACTSCGTSIEKACVRFSDNKRWHLKCFNCSTCGKLIEGKEIKSARYDSVGNFILCPNCTNEDSRLGFEPVSDLMQLIYLLHIALSRSRTAMKVNIGDVTLEQQSPQQQVSPRQPTLSPMSPSANSIDGYSKTIEDVTNLRYRRQSQRLSNSIKQNARKSVILEAPEAVQATQDTTTNSDDSYKLSIDRQLSSSSHLSYNPLTPEDEQFNTKKALRIQDEPTKKGTHVNLDRTTDLLKNEKSLTLDDIPRIVAAEQAREQRPNAFKHHNSLYQRQKPIKPVRYKSGSQTNTNIVLSENPENSDVNIAPKVESSEVPKKQKYYSELTKNEHFIMRHIALEAFVQLNGSKFNKDDLLSLIQTRKTATFWDKFKFAGAKTEKGNAVFGVDLIELTKRYGTDSDLGVGPSSLRIPIFIDDVIRALKQKDMSVEGIFRLNGNIKKLRELTEQINKHPTKSLDYSNQNAVQLAALMKKWLRELPNPLLTYNLYDLWINSQNQSNPVLKKRIIQLCYCMLPRSHRNLVEVLLYFFSWVASFAEIDEETGSKMDIHNLATVIAPNILYPKPSNENAGNTMNAANTSAVIQQSGEGFFYAIEVLNQMIEQHEELSIIPEDVLQFYDRCNFNKENMTTKEINHKIEKLLKEDPNYFQNFQMQPLEELMENKEVRSNTICRSQSKFANESHGETTNI